jgi:exosome complex component RRP4
VGDKMPIYFQSKDIVLPGDLLAEGDYKAGTGTFKEDSKIYSAVIGLFEIRGKILRVISLEGTYIPRPNDVVIGKIVDVSATNWKVEIRAPYLANLPAANYFDKPIDPLKSDIRRYLNVGDIIVAKVVSFNRAQDPLLTTKERGLGKLRGGRIIEMSPTKIPRLIGRKGSMVNMIKEETGCRITVGQNGRVWVSCKTPEYEELIEKVIRKIELEAHTSGLTDRVRELIRKEKERLKK